MCIDIRGGANMARRWRTAGRWALVAAAVIALHLLVLGWLGRLPAPATILDAARLVQARLISPPAPPVPPAPVKVTPPPKVIPPRPAEQPALEPDQPPVATAPSGTDTVAPGSSEPQAASAPSRPAPVRPAGAPDDTAHFALPPSTTLRYDTYVNGIRNQNGTLRWATDGKQYTMEVETSIPFLGRYAFQSTGSIDDYGLAPDRYTELRGRRDPATATFGRGTPPTVTFSRNSSSVPLTPGMQDRFSVFMQMVGLLRGAAQRYATPGDTLPFQVVDTRDAEAIRVQFVGEESVTVAGGRNVQARHFVRLPRHAGDRRMVEVWLAESLGWMPARLRQTEPNGLQFELVWQGKE